MKSIILRLESNYLQSLLNSHFSYKDIFKELGVRPYTHNYTLLHRKVRDDNLSLDIFFRNAFIRREELMKKLKRARIIDPKDALIEKSPYTRNTIRRILLGDNLIPYKCDICENPGVHLSNPLVLQIDHKNGVHNDHRLENLRWLCPNCHAQTTTYSGCNNRKKYYCKTCNRETKGYSNICRECSRKKKRKFDVTKEELEMLINTKKENFSSLGRRFGVSDNAVRKRCKTLGVAFGK